MENSIFVETLVGLREYDELNDRYLISVGMTTVDFDGQMLLTLDFGTGAFCISEFEFANNDESSEAPLQFYELLEIAAVSAAEVAAQEDLPHFANTLGTRHELKR
jgi:hypothetical protein